MSIYSDISSLKFNYSESSFPVYIDGVLSDFRLYNSPNGQKFYKYSELKESGVSYKSLPEYSYYTLDNVLVIVNSITHLHKTNPIMSYLPDSIKSYLGDLEYTMNSAVMCKELRELHISSTYFDMLKSVDNPVGDLKLFLQHVESLRFLAAVGRYNISLKRSVGLAGTLKKTLPNMFFLPESLSGVVSPLRERISELGENSVLGSSDIKVYLCAPNGELMKSDIIESNQSTKCMHIYDFYSTLFGKNVTSKIYRQFSVSYSLFCEMIRLWANPELLSSKVYLYKTVQNQYLTLPYKLEGFDDLIADSAQLSYVENFSMQHSITNLTSVELVDNLGRLIS